MKEQIDQVIKARLTAARILFSVLETGAYTNIDSLRQLENADLDSRDRAFVSALIYGTISRVPSIDWLINQVSSRSVEKIDPWIRTILRLGVWQIYWSHSVPDSAAVDESVKLARRLKLSSASGFVNAVLRAILRQKPELPRNRPALYYGLPPELYGYLKLWYKDEAADLAAAFLREPEGIVIRINRLRTNKDDLIRELAAQDVAALPGHYCPDALIIRLKGKPLRSLPAYQNGKFMVQSEAAMMAGYLINPRSGEDIVDLCAAPGGKTCHIAELSSDLARISARDIHAERLELVREHAARLGLSSITCTTGDATGHDRNRREKFTKVLLDAPCSGLGLLAHKPEIRLNMTHERMQSLYPLQKQMLDYAADLLRPGGTLIYCTCTINPQENSEAVNDLIRRQDGQLLLEPIDHLVPEAVRAEADLARQAEQGYLQFLPHRHRTDGFFLARLKRIESGI